MKKQNRIIYTIALAAVGALAFTGCSATSDGAGAGTSSAPDKGEIVFFTVSAQIPAIKNLSDSVATFLEADGYTVSVQDANFNPIAQAQQIEQAVNTGSIVGAWIFPVSPDALAGSLDLLKSKHIPAVLEAGPSDFGLDGAQPGLIFAGADFSAYGTAIGEAAAACATKNGGTEALFLQATDTAGGAAVVASSTEAAYKAGAPDVPIVGGVQAADPATAQTQVSQLLIAHPGADVVIAASDETAIGAVGAYKAAGTTPKCLVAGGGGPDVMAAYNAGEINAVIAWDYQTGVETSGTDLLRLLGDPTAVGAVNSTPITVLN